MVKRLVYGQDRTVSSDSVNIFTEITPNFVNRCLKFSKYAMKSFRPRRAGIANQVQVQWAAMDKISCHVNTRDDAADKEHITRLQLFDSGEASAAAAVDSSRLTLRLTCR